MAVDRFYTYTRRAGGSACGTRVERRQRPDRTDLLSARDSVNLAESLNAPLVGNRLGFYEILSPIGAGEMEEVYKARDTKLDREVAIMVPPSALARDPAVRCQKEDAKFLVPQG